MKSSLYYIIWEKALPSILSAIHHDGGNIQLCAEDFKSVGNRYSYSFRLDIVYGNVPISCSSAVARDLKTVLDNSAEFSSLAQDRLICIRMGHSFILEIDSEKVRQNGIAMDKQDFVSKLKKHLHRIVNSITENVSYTIDIAPGLGLIRGVRGSTGNSFEIDINELLQAYNKCERPYTTTKLREYITGRVLSPALAILTALDKAMEGEK